ncbi:pyruvate, phosphate dikinase [Brachyspira aalborgi]|uniref:Pyruvate, phosphate dikinase n=1 Tax=Brachyspira aalborgi TaxID=29522 RepID=A0A5C8FRE0_9SPIR|nr:pyruvate, phosphate dikinase [Brachyspira aalborgi]TXJ38545.1 pyruvate, phosphate dikinase [Brachyspira aalborgi]TXJ52248.1 pyruvate, phosphate dikinase [Brachyspira aalborgi]
MALKKMVYFFGNGKSEGAKETKALLGGKGLGLAQMTESKVPVPAGFTITTEVCDYYSKNKSYPKDLKKLVDENIKKLEKAMNMEFGNEEKPLLVSVRSGAAISMPGMMDTILNLGINEKVVNGMIKKTNNPRFAWDAYRRFIQMFGDVAMGVDHDKFEEILDNAKHSIATRVGKPAKEVKDTDLNVDDLKEVVDKYKEMYKREMGEDFPEDPKIQLWHAINAVFRSWNNPRAEAYRKLNDIRNLLGTAVNVQAMVFGNMGDTSATGVCFSRNPATGENKFYGEFLINAQGEDVVAGIRDPQQITLEGSLDWAKNNNISEFERKGKYPSLEEVMPDVYKQLVKYKDQLLKYYKDVQDMEFTIQEKKLYMLQTRSGKRTAAAAVRIAVELAEEKIISKEEAIMRVNPSDLDQLLHPVFDPEAKKEATILAKGLNASPGAAVGKVVFAADRAEKQKEEGENVILVRIETSPEDIKGMNAAEGILTARGGATSHAAVVARGMGKCCVAGCSALDINYTEKCMRIGDKIVYEGDYISIDGSTGEVMLGQVATKEAEMSEDFKKLMKWADDTRKLEVHTNADTPHDAQIARSFGAEGIGLCRTEHMFFNADRIKSVRQLILVAKDVKQLQAQISEAERAGKNNLVSELKDAYREPKRLYDEALDNLFPMQMEDFIGIFKAMDGYPVTVRLLDPPLHEFIPHEDSQLEELSNDMGVAFEKLRAIRDSLHEVNPMLGHRGCRLGITYPEIYDMQAKAIIEAAVKVSKNGVKVHPEIMIPLVGTLKELKIIKDRIIKIAEEVFEKEGVRVSYKVGTMIEVPRAALVADKIATEAEFFSFGTNDLTQMGGGFSRDDAGKFLKDYVDKEIYEKDPFQSLDQEGIGELLRIAVSKGRETNKKLIIGICGEHGGDPATVMFCHDIGLDYVSCSPYRVPIAILAAAQGVIEQKKKAKQTAKKTVNKAVKKASKNIKKAVKKAGKTLKASAKKSNAKKVLKKKSTNKKTASKKKVVSKRR